MENRKDPAHLHPGWDRDPDIFFFLKGLGKTASSGKNQVFIKLREN
jgi:hypothetical protein